MPCDCLCFKPVVFSSSESRGPIFSLSSQCLRGSSAFSDLNSEQESTLSMSPTCDAMASSLYDDAVNISYSTTQQDLNSSSYTSTLAPANLHHAPWVPESSPTTEFVSQLAPVSDDVLMALTEPFLMSWCMRNPLPPDDSAGPDAYWHDDGLPQSPRLRSGDISASRNANTADYPSSDHLPVSEYTTDLPDSLYDEWQTFR